MRKVQLGKIYYEFELENVEIENLVFPVIIIDNSFEYRNLSKKSNKIDVNNRLVQLLKTKESISKIDEILYEMIEKDKMNILTNFGMLFDPDLNIDLVRLFVNLSRKEKIIVMWPGYIEGLDLIYAVPTSEDYRVYNLDKYAISCIKKGE